MVGAAGAIGGEQFRNQRLTTFSYFDDNRNMETKDVVNALGALAQATRLAIFRQLVEAGPAGMSPGDMAARLDVAAPTLSFHLKELVHARLIDADPRGRFILYRADYAAIEALIGFLTENCCRGSGDCATACKPAAARSCLPAAATSSAASSASAAPTAARGRAAASRRAPAASTRRIK